MEISSMFLVKKNILDSLDAQISLKIPTRPGIKLKPGQVNYIIFVHPLWGPNPCCKDLELCFISKGGSKVSRKSFETKR